MKILKKRTLNNPSVYQCTVCKDKVYSRYNGEFASCQCGATAVDQTAHYTRVIGLTNEYLGTFNEVFKDG